MKNDKRGKQESKTNIKSFCTYTENSNKGEKLNTDHKRICKNNIKCTDCML